MSLEFGDLQLHATGGLGEVYRATEKETSRKVALKFIRNNFTWDEEIRKRFLMEAEITARLEHPGVVPVHGLGVTTGNRPFYAMRFVEGETLDDAIRRHYKGDRETGEKATTAAARSLEFRSLLQRFVSVCNTMAYAHNRGIVHRDIKPHNILLGRFGETLVVDWGLAIPVNRDEEMKASGEQTLHVHSKFGSGGKEDSGASSGSGAGTPAYMSPEQAAGSLNIGPASDIYSLGATLFKILTGVAPFHGDPFLVMQQVTQGDFSPPSIVGEHVPKPLDAICLKAMSKDPAARYRTALEMAADVEHYLGDEAVSALPENAFQGAARWARHHRGVVASLLVSLLLLTLGGVGVAISYGRQAQRESQLRGQAVAAQESEHDLREDSLQASAEFAASSIANQIDIRWRVLEKEAGDLRLPGWLKKINENPADESAWAPLQEWMDRMLPQHANVLCRNWNVNCKDGTQVARFPSHYEDGRRYGSLGKKFAYRDYFHGRGRDFDDEQDIARPPLTQPVHLSTVLESFNDATLTVIFSVPIRDPETGETIGVFGMSVELGEFADLKVRLPEGQNVLLVDTRQYFMQRKYPEQHSESGEGLVLHHADMQNLEDLKSLPHIPPQILTRMRSAKEAREKNPTSEGEARFLLDETYRDPLSTDESQHWMAAFAPVTVKSRPQTLRDTGWYVIVQQAQGITQPVAGR